MPVSGILLVFMAGTYRQHRETTAAPRERQQQQQQDGMGGGVGGGECTRQRGGRGRGRLPSDFTGTVEGNRHYIEGPLLLYLGPTGVS